MKHITITSILAIMMAIPSFAAVDINANATSADCDNNTLHTTTGPATLTADWSANTINLEWYSDDTKLEVPTASNTCTYDGDITIPTTNPTKPGYNFAGWAVRETIQQCNLSGLDTSVNGSATGYTRLNGDAGYNESTYGLTPGSGEWATTFSYGTVKGVALCSATSGTYATAGTPDESETGGYCWCKGTGFAEPNSSEYCPVASSSWVFASGAARADFCATICADDCARNVRINSDFRPAVFGQ